MAEAIVIEIEIEPREPDLLPPLVKRLLMLGLAGGSLLMLAAFIVVTVLALT